MDEHLVKALAEMEPMLGLPQGFIARLLKDDDWSFVIKMHALLESTLTVVLAKAFQRDEIRDPLAHVEMSHKINLLSALNLFTSEERGALRELSRLRNELVHNVEQVTFSFESYLQNPDKRKDFVKKFGFGWAEQITFGDGKSVPREEITRSNPKFTMWLVFIYLIGFAHLELWNVELRRQRANFEKKKAESDSEKLRQLETTLQSLAGLASQALAGK